MIKRSVKRNTVKFISIYANPKTGKTAMCAELNNALFLTFEKGIDYHEVDYLDCSDASRLAESLSFISKNKEVINNYDYIVIDTLTAMELVFDNTFFYQKDKQASLLEKSNPGGPVTALPNGLGWGLLRTKILAFLDFLKEFKSTIIILAHIKDKLVNRDTGEIIQSAEIEARGKLGAIICSYSDAVGKLYRDKNNDLILSFRKDEINDAKLGCRLESLDSKEFNLGKPGSLGINLQKVLALQ
jgi:hypothetical protein